MARNDVLLINCSDFLYLYLAGYFHLAMLSVRGGLVSRSCGFLSASILTVLFLTHSSNTREIPYENRNIVRGKLHVPIPFLTSSRRSRLLLIGLTRNQYQRLAILK
jgi:hypothetical protein